jgi:ParB-like chromosome segregation protein Spo0J
MAEKQYEFHPIANVFPLIVGDEYDEFVEDVRKNGLLTPIMLYEGKILDGRNRYRACLDARVTPQFEECAADIDPIALVVSLNIHRRQLTTSQRAMIAAKLANMPRGGDPSTREANASKDALVSQPKAAEIMRVSRPEVQRAKKVLTDGVPELVQAVEAGEMTVGMASEIAQAEPAAQRAAMADPEKAKAIRRSNNVARGREQSRHNLANRVNHPVFAKLAELMDYCKQSKMYLQPGPLQSMVRAIDAMVREILEVSDEHRNSTSGKTGTNGGDGQGAIVPVRAAG